MVTNSMNPFDDDNEEWNSSYDSSSFAKKARSFAPASTARTYRNTSTHRHVHNPSSSNQKTPLWMARPVEWPLVNSLPAITYNKLLRASKQTSHTSKKLPFGGSNQDDGIPKSSSPMDNASLTTAVGKSSNAENNDSASSTGYFPGLSGMMGRVFTSNAAGMNASTAGKNVNAEDDSLNMRPRALKSPRHGCVAAFNGWIVAGIDLNVCIIEYNQSPLYIACWKGNIRLVNLLLSWNAISEKHFIANGKMTIFNVAKENNHLDTYRLLQEFFNSASLPKYSHYIAGPTLRERLNLPSCPK